MTVYYIADEEKPSSAVGVKFYTDHASAVAASAEMRGKVYQFEVNDKCDTNSFGMDTQMVFNKDPDTGDLKFLASGQWVEIHEILNIPFYYDFEARSKSFVSMSQRYFLSHYKIVPKVGQSEIKSTGKDVVSEVINCGAKPTGLPMGAVSSNTVDNSVIDALFGGM